MATRGVITEAQLMAAMPRSANPNLGFRGNPDGEQGPDLVDYGVYAQPLHNALARFGYRSDIISYGNNGKIISYLRRGWPVVTWVTWHLIPHTPRLAESNGVQFFLVPGEHAITAVGFGDNRLIANDPSDGTRVRYPWQQFDRAWGYFGNMALAVDPCPLPGDVQSLSLTTISATSATITWSAAPHATRYHVTVIRHISHDKLVFQGDVTGEQLVIANPHPGATYQISVQATNDCGDVSSVARLAVQIPKLVPTPTPSPTPVETSIPLPSATATATATQTSSPSPSATS